MNQTTYFIGSIACFGFNFTPIGWAPCNGQLLAISEYEALYALIGTTYGGDGVTSFGVPDLQGRTILNQGTGPGLSRMVMGQKGGTDSVTMTTAQMPMHNHPLVPAQINAQTKVPVTTTGGGTNEPGSGEFGFGAGGSFPAIFSDSSTRGTTDFLAGVQSATDLNTMTAGSSQPLDITNPFLGLNFCISLYGIFPTQG